MRAEIAAHPLGKAITAGRHINCFLQACGFLKSRSIISHPVTDSSEVLHIHNISEAILQHARLRRTFRQHRCEVAKAIRRLEDLNLAIALLHEGSAM